MHAHRDPLQSSEVREACSACAPHNEGPIHSPDIGQGRQVRNAAIIKNHLQAATSNAVSRQSSKVCADKRLLAAEAAAGFHGLYIVLPCALWHAVSVTGCAEQVLLCHACTQPAGVQHRELHHKPHNKHFKPIAASMQCQSLWHRPAGTGTHGSLALLTRPPLIVDSVRMQLSGSVKDTKPTFLSSTTTWKDSWVPICRQQRTQHNRVSSRRLTANKAQPAQWSG
jgi:hypothetical protein